LVGAARCRGLRAAEEEAAAPSPRAGRAPPPRRPGHQQLPVSASAPFWLLRASFAPGMR